MAKLNKNKMFEIVIITKYGSVEGKNVKEINNNQYKFCNYKSDKDFGEVHAFNHKSSRYHIFGKKNGRANNENKYEFPPPIDTTLFFGNMCIIKTDKSGEYANLSVSEWEKVYEDLFGGFEDIGGDDSDERSVDSEVYSDGEYTKEGYLKDDFIVEDDEELEEEEYEDTDEEEFDYGV